MDRRKKRTSTNQYMMYIDMMERDTIFATGRVPRDVDMNYLHERWKELSDKLNTCSSGPKLTAGEWRKRLNDWKNTTRCKYRRSVTSEDVTLTTLEMKALQLFGKAPNVSNATDELSIHLKSEKDEDDMEHQRTSETFQKELQAAVEEAIGGDDEEEVIDEPEEHEEDLTDPLPQNGPKIVSVTSSGAGASGGSGGTTTTYRTIVVDNTNYQDADEEEPEEYIAHRRQASSSSSISINPMPSKSSGAGGDGGTIQRVITNSNAPSTTVTKLINGEISLKRMRTHAPEHIIYEVSSVKKSPTTQQHPPPPPLQHHQQLAQPQRIIKTLHNSDAQQHHYESVQQPTTSTASITTAGLMGSADAREIARQLKRLADIKAEKLKFEVARFKFNNPGFVFNSHLI